MEIRQLEFNSEFEVVAGNERGQAAVMVIAPGESEGGPDNRHPWSDQWLFVVSGSGEAIVSGETHQLSAGSLLLIEKNETHEIRNTGAEPLRTLDLYVPPAYDANGDDLSEKKPVGGRIRCDRWQRPPF